MQYSWARHVAFPDIKYILGMNIVFTRWIRFQQECYHIAENRKLSQILRFCGYTQKFLREIWGVALFGTAKATNPRKFSPRKTYFSPIRESFLPQKFPTIQKFGITGGLYESC